MKQKNNAEDTDDTGAHCSVDESKADTALQDALDAANTQVSELTDQLQRLQAEFENYLKRTQRETAEQQKLATKDLLKQLLTVNDNLERALHSKNNGEELHKGIELVYQDLAKILRKEGVHPIEALGKPFDPTYHEVLLTIIDPEKTDGTIVEEYERGYVLHGKVLRYSKVKISNREE